MLYEMAMNSFSFLLQGRLREIEKGSVSDVETEKKMKEDEGKYLVLL
jgi:hypothetical protein